MSAPGASRAVAHGRTDSENPAFGAGASTAGPQAQLKKEEEDHIHRDKRKKTNKKEQTKPALRVNTNTDNEPDLFNANASPWQGLHGGEAKRKGDTAAGGGPPERTSRGWSTVRTTALSERTRTTLSTPTAGQRAAGQTANNSPVPSSTATKIQEVTMKMKSGKLLGGQRRSIRKGFLIFTLTVTGLTIIALAMFGTQATDNAQLQTVRLLGRSLVRDVAKDLELTTQSGERECLNFAVNAPSFYNSSSRSAPNPVAVKSGKNASTFFWATEATDRMFATLNSERRTHLSWHGFYFARASDGMVMGVTSSSPPRSTSATASATAATAETTNTTWMECWGNLGSAYQTRRTAPMADSCTWLDVVRTTKDSGSVYDYDATGRPWFKLAMAHPGRIVWTQPYTFRATGKTGLTVALATQPGGGFRRHQAGDGEGGMSVYAIDITISGLEDLFTALANSIKTAEFGSQAADVGIVDRNTSMHKSTKYYETLLASSKTAHARLGELGVQTISGSLINDMFGIRDASTLQNRIEAAAKQNADNALKSRDRASSPPIQQDLCEWAKYSANLSSVEKMTSGKQRDVALEAVFETCPTQKKSPWFIFAETFSLNADADPDDYSLRWDAVIVVIVRKANFLAALELISRTIFPFIAAALVLLIIPTSHTVTRLILRSTKENLKADGKLLKSAQSEAALVSETKTKTRTKMDSASSVAAAAGSSGRSKRASYLTRLHSRSGNTHRAFDGRTCCEVFWEISHRLSRSIRQHRYLTWPMYTAVGTAVVVHTLVTVVDNAPWMIALLFVLTRVLMAWLLHSLWMDAGDAIGFGHGLSRSDLTAQAFSITVLIVWICSVIVDAAMGAYDSNRFDHHDSQHINVAGIVRLFVEIAMFLAFTFGLVATRDPVTKHTAPSNACHKTQDTYFAKNRNPWPLRIVVTISVLAGGTYFFLWNMGVPRTIKELPYFFLPLLFVFVLTGVTAHCDKTVRHTWPRPRIAMYTLVTTMALVWLLQWVTVTVCAFWSAVNLSAESKAICLQDIESEVGRGDSGGDSGGGSDGGNTGDCSTSLWLNTGYFDGSTWLLLGWTGASMLLSLFLDYFVETAVSSGEGLDIYFGISMFKAMLSSLIFLTVKPLDGTFYLLLLVKCAQHMAMGLGLKSYIWDSRCSKARWKKDFHTHALKTTKRALRWQFAIVAPVCGKAVMVVLILLEILQLQIRYGSGELDAAGDSPDAGAGVWIPPLTGRKHSLERISMMAGFFVQAAFYFICNEIIETILANRMEKYQHRVSTLEAFRTVMMSGHHSQHEVLRHFSNATPMGAVGRQSFGGNTNSHKKSIKLDGSIETAVAAMEVRLEVEAAEERKKKGAKAHGRKSSKLTQRISSMVSNAQKRQRKKMHFRPRSNSISRGGLGGEALTSVGGQRQYKWARHRAEIFHTRGKALLIWSVYMCADVVLRMIVARKDSTKV